MEILKSLLSRGNSNIVFIIIIIDILLFLRLFEDFFVTYKKVQDIVSFRLLLKFAFLSNKVNFAAKAVFQANVYPRVGYSKDSNQSGSRAKGIAQSRAVDYFDIIQFL